MRSSSPRAGSWAPALALAPILGMALGPGLVTGGCGPPGLVALRQPLELPAEPAPPDAAGALAIKRERDVEAGPDGVARIAVVGDPGIRDGGWQGDSDGPRRAVASRLAAICAERPCDLVLVLGDNLYTRGVRAKHADEDTRALAGILEGLSPGGATPVYPILGNHDWGPRVASHATADRQLAWIAEAGPPLAGNAHFYSFEAGPAALWALDTNALVRVQGVADDPRLARWAAAIETSGRPWRIAFGHHPVRSTGGHGDAGRFRDRGLPLWRGKAFAAWMERHILDRVDLYLAGHEHSLQLHLGSAAGGTEMGGAAAGDATAGEIAAGGAGGGRSTALAIVGSAAKCSGPGKRPRQAAFEAYHHGLAVVEASPERLSITFHVASETGEGGPASWAWSTWSAQRVLGGAWVPDPEPPPGRGAGCRAAGTCCR